MGALRLVSALSILSAIYADQTLFQRTGPVTSERIYKSCFFWDGAKDSSIMSLSHIGSQAFMLKINLDYLHSGTHQSEFDLRTLDPEGVIFYGDKGDGINWFLLALRDGHPEIQLSNQHCLTAALSGDVLNDGKWRRIMVQSESKSIRLLVDGKPSLVINILPNTGFLENLSTVHISLGKSLINESEFILPLRHRLDACITNWNWLQQNSSWLADKVARNPNIQCPTDIMPGTFFPGGGVVVFQAGSFQNDSESPEDWSLRFEAVIRPSKHTGVVLAILSKTYNLLMQLDIVLKDWQEVFRLKLGDAVLFELPPPSELCNGLKIVLSLSAEMISLKVGNKLRTLQETHDSIASLRSAWIEEEAFVVLGGLPALDTLGYGWYYFQGCMQNLRMQGKSLDMNQALFVHHAILTHSCPASK
ncbi:sex hormone-binding globulin [Mobula hypostoma]|uniref:sex hormone-binding globulin n=1 Tax=Mobula hypostoma TaxID=723540 RepID=UPI002FC2BE6A